MKDILLFLIAFCFYLAVAVLFALIPPRPNRKFSWEAQWK